MAEENMQIYDTIIIGGGMAGLTAAIYLKRACKRVLIIEKEIFGGQITKAVTVENYPGIKSISGMELGKSTLEQATSLGVEYLYEEVISLSKDNGLFTVVTDNNKYLSKTVICASGTNPKKLDIPNIDKYLGKGLSYCATCDGAFFKDKKAVVVGGGNTAITDALYLSNICSQVYLIHYKDSLRAEPLKVSILKDTPNINIIYNARITKVNGEDKITSITVSKDNKEFTIDTDSLFVAIGSTPNTNILDGLLELDEAMHVSINHDLETSVAGLFLAGDVRKKPVRQLTTAISDGTVAAVNVIEYLNTL